MWVVGKADRFIGDFDNEVGPFVQMSDIEGFGLDIYAIDGFRRCRMVGKSMDYDEVTTSGCTWITVL